MLEYIQAKLALAYRSRLTNYVQHEYFSDKTFYTVGNLEFVLRNVWLTSRESQQANI